MHDKYLIAILFVGKPALHARQVGGDRGSEEDHQLSQGDNQDPAARCHQANGGARRPRLGQGQPHP